MLAGSIDSFSDGLAAGWFYSFDPSARPMLFVDGHLATPIQYPIPRPDVSGALGTTQDCGFSVRVQSAKSNSQFSLCTLVGGNLVVVKERTFDTRVSDHSSFAAIIAAEHISRLKDAVAITCWDGGHNPIGRAKVLYDIAEQHHPVVMFAYLFQEFGGRLWQPLLGSELNLVVIPWEKRDIYHQLLRTLDVRFDTIWMCKPRYPTFLLSSILSHADTSVILDLDDNEAHFSRSNAAETKIYGLGTIGLCKILTDRVESRTVASVSLQKDHGGTIVRHARTQLEVTPKSDGKDRAPRVAFVGTVRPHKNLPLLARAIRISAYLAKRDIEFHVLGDIQPENLRNELAALGAHLGGTVRLEELPSVLSDFDVIVTGFPPQRTDQAEIARYQISAKIGDGLAIGRPVLVPRTASVEDLDGIPGVYLFDESDFKTKLLAAIKFSQKIALPKEFGLAGAHEAFADALGVAQKSDRAGAIFAGIGETVEPSPIAGKLPKRPALVLVWKQNDAGVYGRRVDQLARSYKRSHPDHDVIVLQFAQTAAMNSLVERSGNYLSEANIVWERMTRSIQQGGFIENGIRYDVIQFSDPKNIADLMLQYLGRCELVPDNTLLVLFPVLPHFDRLSRMVSEYPVVVDVVDNQFGWVNEERCQQMAAHYFTMTGIADAIVFNSENNRFFFEEHGLIQNRRPQIAVIPNWYESLPNAREERLPSTIDLSKFNVVYSGNLNDRIDFKLMTQLLDIDDLELHIFGTAERAPVEFRALIAKCNVIYHGARPEKEVFSALSNMSLAIIPHIKDHISEYMNPLKAYMYKAAGLFCVATDVSGLEPDGQVRKLTSTAGEFFQSVLAERQKWLRFSSDVSRITQLIVNEEHALHYLALINEVRAVSSRKTQAPFLTIRKRRAG